MIGLSLAGLVLGFWAGTVAPGWGSRAAAQDEQDLFLAVVINDQPTGILATFRLRADGSLAATATDLEGVSIDPAGGSEGADGLIPLDTLPGLAYRYDEVSQAVLVTISDDGRKAHEIDVSGTPDIDLTKVQSSYGFVLNYSLFGSAQHDFDLEDDRFSLSGAFEARLLSPYGVVSNSALARIGSFDDWDDPSNELVRLESYWRTVDPESALVYRAGDAIAGSLAWTSAWRLGGLQFQRDFEIRPDLVTTPSADLGGTAAVPSSLDLYIDNLRVFSGEVPAGPFDFIGLPLIGGGGTARLVMEDALGRQTVTELPYYYTPGLLRDGLLDFSAELGFPRLGYGTESFSYAPDIAASGTVRYGLTDWLTTEAHAEGTRGLINGGLGFVMGLGAFGAIGGSAAGSDFDDATGAKLTASYQVSRGGISLFAATDRVFGDYQDVASVSAARDSDLAPLSTRARSIDRLGLSLPLFFDPSSVSFGYTQIDAEDEGDSRFLTVSYSRSLFQDVSFYATAYRDFAREESYGMFAGLSISLGGHVSGTATVSTSPSQTTYGADLVKSAANEEGAWGWALRDRETDGGDSFRSAGVNYRAAFASLEAAVEQSGELGRVTLSAEGSIVAAGGGFFLADRIEDSFAVVEAGGPNVDILLNTRRVATTDGDGRALIPDLRAYRNNMIGIDPANLPLDQQPASTEALVVPSDRGGVVVDFGVRPVEAAIVTLTGPDGAFLPVGAPVTLDATGEASIVGYDGRTWLTGLAARNEISVALPQNRGTCRAAFDYAPQPGQQVEIGPVTCR